MTQVNARISEAERKYVREQIVDKVLEEIPAVTLLGEAGISKPVETIEAIAKAPTAVLQLPEIRERLIEIFGAEEIAGLGAFKEKCQDKDSELLRYAYERMPLLIVGDDRRVQVNEDIVKKLHSDKGALRRIVEDEKLGIADRGSAFVMKRRALTVHDVMRRPVDEHRILENANINLQIGDTETHTKEVIPKDKPLIIAAFLAASDEYSVETALKRIGYKEAEIDFAEVIKATLVMPKAKESLEKHLPDLLRRIPDQAKRDEAFRMIVRHAEAGKDGELNNYFTTLCSKAVFELLSESERGYVLEHLAPQFFQAIRVGGFRFTEGEREDLLEYEEEVEWVVKNAPVELISRFVKSPAFTDLLVFRRQRMLSILLEHGRADVIIENVEKLLSGTDDGIAEHLLLIMTQHPDLACRVQLHLPNMSNADLMKLTMASIKAEGGVDAFFEDPDLVLGRLRPHADPKNRLGVLNKVIRIASERAEEVLRLAEEYLDEKGLAEFKEKNAEILQENIIVHWP